MIGFYYSIKTCFSTFNLILYLHQNENDFWTCFVQHNFKCVLDRSYSDWSLSPSTLAQWFLEHYIENLVSQCSIFDFHLLKPGKTKYGLFAWCDMSLSLPVSQFSRLMTPHFFSSYGIHSSMKIGILSWKVSKSPLIIVTILITSLLECVSELLGDFTKWTLLGEKEVSYNSTVTNFRMLKILKWIKI